MHPGQRGIPRLVAQVQSNPDNGVNGLAGDLHAANPALDGEPLCHQDGNTHAWTRLLSQEQRQAILARVRRRREDKYADPCLHEVYARVLFETLLEEISHDQADHASAA